MWFLIAAAIYTHTETLAQVVARAELIAVVTPTKEGYRVKELLLGKRPDAAFLIGDSYEGVKFAKPSEPGPDGSIESPLVLRYATTVKDFKAARELIVFLHVSGKEYRFAVDDAYESVALLPRVREAIAKRKP